MNEEQTLKPQCERPMEAYEGPELTEMNKVESCESKEQREQREQRRRMEILKNWDIRIQVFDRGCVVHVGCKSIAFTSIEAGYKEIGSYLENPLLVANEYGFSNHI